MLFFHPFEKGFGFRVLRTQFERVLKSGLSPRQVAPMQEVIHTGKEMRLRIERPHAGDAIRDFGGFVEHPRLVVFGGEEIKPRIVARVGGDLFFQDLYVPPVLAPPWFGARREMVMNDNAGFLQPSASRNNRSIDGFVDAAAITIFRPIRKEPHNVIPRCGFGH